MLKFIARRLAISLGLILAASYVMYLLVAASGDPLADIRESGDPNMQAQIAYRTALLNLDVPAPLRYFIWLGGAARCLVPFAGCDLGTSIQNIPVTEMLPVALQSTIRLLVAATVLAVLIGILIGVVSALRQNTGFDYVLTFLVFLIFSLPSFFIAVLLKEFLAIGFNDFLRDPVIPVWIIALLSAAAGVVWQSIVAGDPKRRLIVFSIGAGATAAVLAMMSATRWFGQPALGPVIIAAVAITAGGLVLSVTAGLRHRGGILTVGVTAATLVGGYYGLQGLFAISSVGTLLIVGVVVVVAGAGIGILAGGVERRSTLWVGMVVAATGYLLIVLDRFMQAWPAYTNLGAVGGRPIATVGASNPSVRGSLWIEGLDVYAHLLLPTIALLLISLASYTRYVRAGMLDVLKQDYVRTARAKGLPETVVVMRHAFRNSLIPLATFVPVDIATIVGGAVVTEQVFAINGMGQMFIRALQSVDPNPVMAYFLVVGAVVLVANLIADISYASLDPRIRLAR